MTSSLRFDVTATDAASEKFRNLAENVERVRRELELLDKAKANPKVRLDGVEQARTDLDRIRERMAGLSDIRVKVKLDAPGAADIRRVERLRDALRELGTVNGDQRIRIGVEGLESTTPNLIRRTAKALAELKAVGDVRIRIDLDGAAEAIAAILALRRELRGLPNTTTTRVRADTGSSETAIRRLSSSLSGATPSARTLAIALASLASPGVIASIGALAGSLALVPAGLAAIGAVAGTAALGLSGIGDAFTELSAADKASATGAAAAASARTAAAERIRSAQESLAQAQQSADRESVDGARQVADARRALADAQVSAAERIKSAEQDLADAQTQSAERVASAQRSLADAREQSLERIASAQQSLADAQARYAADVIAGSKAIESAQTDAADAAERSARSVASAERNVTDAQRARTDAQNDLTRAVMDAREAQEDLTLSLSGAALREERAVLDLQIAQEKLASAQASGVGGHDLQDLSLDAREAEQSLKEIRERYGDLQAEAADAAKTGIDGSAGVVAAQRRVEDATTKVGDAEQNLTDARDASAKSAQDSSDRIAAAQANLADTVTRGSRSVADAQSALTKAQTQGARDVADAQDALVKAQTDGARRVSDAQTALTKAELDGARQVSDAREQLARTAESAAQQQTDAVARVVKAQRDLVTALGDTGTAADAASVKAQAALAALAPNARDLVETLHRLGPAFNDLHLDVQQRLFGGVADRVSGLAATYLPMLHDELGKIADALNLGVTKFLDWGRQAGTVDGVREILANTGIAARDAAGFGTDLSQAFLDIAQVGSRVLPDLARALADAGRDFAAWADKAKASGELERIIRGAMKALEDLAVTGGNVAGILGKIFTAAQSNGADFLSVLRDVTGWVNDALGSTAGRDGLSKIFGNLHDIAVVLAPIIGDLARNVGEILVTAFEKLGPPIVRLFQEHGPKIMAVLDGLAKFIIEQVIPALAAIVDFTTDFLIPAITTLVDFITDYVNPAFVHFSAGVQTAVDGALEVVADAVSGMLGALGLLLDGLATIPGPFQGTFRDAARSVNDARTDVTNFADTLRRVDSKTVELTLKTDADARAHIVKRAIEEIPGRHDTNIYANPNPALGSVQAVKNAIAGLQQVTVFGVKLAGGAAAGGVIPRFSGGTIPTRRFASGGIAGVLPGYTPGRDVFTVGYAGGGAVGLSGGEAIMRPEFTRAVGRRFVDEGNRAARTGGVPAVRRFMGAVSGGDGASLRVAGGGGTGSGTTGSPDVVAAIGRLGERLGRVERQVTITQNFTGVTDKNAAAKSAQALRTDAALGVFG